MSDKISIKLSAGYKLFNGGEIAGFELEEAEYLVYKAKIGVPADKEAEEALEYGMLEKEVEESEDDESEDNESEDDESEDDEKGDKGDKGDGKEKFL